MCENGEVKRVQVRVGDKPTDPKFVITDLLPHLATEQMTRKATEVIKGEGLNILIGSVPSETVDEKCSEKIKLAIMEHLNREYGMTEADAYKLCQEHGLLSPIYAHCRRNGCWFCPNASDSELLHIVTKHPDMFDRLIEWEKEDNIFHRRLTRRETPSEVKARLLSKSQTGFSSPKRK